MNKVRTLLANLFIGIPGGCLIFMSMLMFHALLSAAGLSGAWLMLVILCITAFITGLLARLVRPLHGLGAAIASGVVAALIILFLWQKAAAGTAGQWVFGPFGILAAIVFSTLGGWLLPRLRRGKKKK